MKRSEFEIIRENKITSVLTDSDVDIEGKHQIYYKYKDFKHVRISI